MQSGDLWEKGPLDLFFACHSSHVRPRFVSECFVNDTVLSCVMGHNGLKIAGCTWFGTGELHMGSGVLVI